MSSTRLVAVACLFLVCVTSPAAAQKVSNVSRPPAKAEPVFLVKTVPLHHLTSTEAMRLLSPYVRTPGGGVYEVSSNIRAVTIREVQTIYNDMLAVLQQYDRDPATVVLSFQLIAAENSGARDPAVAGLDSLLRSVLKFSGYRLLNTSVATAGENQIATQTLTADGEPLTLTVQIADLRVEGNEGSVHLYVSLTRPAMMATAQSAGRPSAELFSTGVRVPIGQTVVLGTSAVEGGQRAMILTVRPQLAKR